jgi:hypothetical protein
MKRQPSRLLRGLIVGKALVVPSLSPPGKRERGHSDDSAGKDILVNQTVAGKVWNNGKS